MRPSALAFVILLAAPFAAAQNAAPAVTNGVASEAQAAYSRVKPNVLKAAERMPDADFYFKPVPDIRTFARIVNHVTEAQFHTCTTLNGTPFDQKAVPSDTADKATILAGLRASFEACDKAYAGLSDASYMEILAIGPVHRSRIGMAWANISHDNEQYAELATYLRLKGITPPSAEK